MTRYLYLGPTLLLVASQLSAQTPGLRGQVSDQSGALVPSARVTATSASSGTATVATAGADGSYAFLNLAPGDYTVQASAPNLVLAQPARVTLTSGTTTLNLQLRVAATAQQVTIQDNAGPAVSTDAANNASAIVISGDALDALADDPDDL